MKNFKTKNFFWVAFWVALAFGNEYGRAPMLDWWLPQYTGWQWNLLGFSPIILSGLYNYFFINEKPYKKDAARAYRLTFFAFFYFLLICLALLWRGLYLVVIFSIPWGMFLGNSIKYLKGFQSK